MRNSIRFVEAALILVFLLTLTTVAAHWALTSEKQGTPHSSASLSGLTPTPCPPPTLPVAPPSRPTPSAAATLTPTPTCTPTPAPPSPPHVTTAPVSPIAATVPLTGPTPTPLPLFPLPEGVFNIVLLGTDASQLLTDVMVVVSINPDVPSVTMLSIPRDLYVWIPGYGFGKINTAYAHGDAYPGGGPGLVKATIEFNLGIPIHYHALVGYDGFVCIVDTLGGVDVPVECELHDTFPDPASPGQGIDIDLYPGIQHLDGQQTLWYVRSRWSTHDFDRNRRQQQVLRALYRQALNVALIPRIPDLWGALSETVQTDLGLDDVLYLGWLGTRLDWTNVKSRFVGPPYAVPSTGDNGAYILLPVPDALGPLVAEALQPPAAGRANQPPFRVELWDGTGRAGLAQVAAERLRWEGFQVISVTPASEVFPHTQIVDFTTTDKGSPLWILTRLYRQTNGDVRRQPTEGSPADFRILLGADYDPCVPTNAIQYVPAPTPTPTPLPTTNP